MHKVWPLYIVLLGSYCERSAGSGACGCCVLTGRSEAAGSSLSVTAGAETQNLSWKQIPGSSVSQSVSRTEPSCFLWAVYWIKSSGQAHSSARCRWLTEISSSFINILLSPQDTELEENFSTVVITDSLGETAWLFHGLFFGGDPYDCPRFKVRITEIYF